LEFIKCKNSFLSSLIKTHLDEANADVVRTVFFIIATSPK
jgi:hypothetical protein